MDDTAPRPGPPPGRADANPPPAAAPPPGPPLREQVLREARTARDLLFPAALTGVLDSPLVGPMGAKCYADSFLDDAGGPADPVERILLQQLLMAHHRVAQLHLRAERADAPEHLKILNAAAARLLGEVRRLALAVKAYRTSAAAKSFTVVRQQNVATEQSVTFVEQPGGPLAKDHLGERGELGDKGADPAPAATDTHLPAEEAARARRPNPRLAFDDDAAVGPRQEPAAGRRRAAQRPQAAGVGG